MLGKHEHGPSALESEATEGFKVWRQVPAVWLYIVSCFTFLSLLLAIVALALGGVALTNSNDTEDRLDNTESTVRVLEQNALSVQPAVVSGQSAAPQQTSAATNARQSPQIESQTVPPGAGQMTSDGRSTPGKNFSSSRGPNGLFRERVFSVVVHGLDTDTFWYTVQQGIKDAADFFGVHFNYDNPENETEHLDFVQMAKDIQKARYSLRDGLVITIPDDEALDAAIKIAAEEIPVLSINSGDQLFEKLDVFTHIGQPESEAGRRAGLKMKELDIQRAMCVKHEETEALNRRCEGFRAGMEPGTVEVVTIPPGQDPVTIIQLVSDTLSEDTDIQGVLTLGPAGFKPTRDVLSPDRVCTGDKTPADDNCIEFGTFDISPEILRAVSAGEVSFAIDQQEYLQGYLAIAFLSIRSNFGGYISPGAGGVVLSGPNFVDSAEKAEALLLRNYTAGSTTVPEDLDIRFIVHGKPESKLWRAVRSGVKYASNRYGINIDYREQPNAALMSEILTSMTRMVEEAIADNVDGLVVSIPEDNANLKAAIEDAIEAGIPVISVNAGDELFEDYGIPLHVGENNTFTGRQTGKKLGEAGVNNAICLIHEATDPILNERCDGLLEGLQLSDPSAKVLRLSEAQAEGAANPSPFREDGPNIKEILKQAVTDAIDDDDTINGVVSLGTVATLPVVEAVESLEDKVCNDNRTPNGTRGCVAVAAFDGTVPTLDLVEVERVMFVVDEQAVLQGILPVMFLTLQNLWGNMPIGMVNSGPGFIDISNVGVFEVFA